MKMNIGMKIRLMARFSLVIILSKVTVTHMAKWSDPKYLVSKKAKTLKIFRLSLGDRVKIRQYRLP